LFTLYLVDAREPVIPNLFRDLLIRETLKQVQGDVLPTEKA